MTVYTTMYLVLVVNFVLGAITLYISWRIHSDVNGIRTWFESMVLATLGCLIAVYAFASSNPEELAQFNRHSLLRNFGTYVCMLAWMRLWLGFREFLSLAVPSTQSSLLVSVGLMLAMLAAYPLSLPLSWAIMLVSVVICTCSVLVIKDLLFAEHFGLATWFSVGGLLLVVSAWGVRGFSTVLYPDMPVYEDLGFWVLFVSAVSAMALTLAMNSMVGVRLNKRLLGLAETDPLTGLFNRRAFFDRLEYCLTLAERQERPLSVVMMDIDHFKAVNDQYGHQVGDELLQHFSQLTRSILRDEDCLARYGGEEFVAILPGATTEQAQQAMERLQETLAQQSLVLSSGEKLEFTLSMGVSTLGPMHIDSEELVAEADKALYQAKTSGRNRVEVIQHLYSPLLQGA